MESRTKGFGKLSIKKVNNIFYKQDPMAQIAAVIKKLKKNKKTKSAEISGMYEERCASLIEQIVEAKYYMYLPDIVRDLQMIYGISLSETQIKQYISLTDIYCNPDTMLYYLNYETYKRMR